jgi:hypothetical protein
VPPQPASANSSRKKTPSRHVRTFALKIVCRMRSPTFFVEPGAVSPVRQIFESQAAFNAAS